MYKAFLSYAQLREYLSVLIENNLLEYLEGSQTYKTTEKGLNFLKMHNEIGELLQTSKARKVIKAYLFVYNYFLFEYFLTIYLIGKINFFLTLCIIR